MWLPGFIAPPAREPGPSWSWDRHTPDSGTYSSRELCDGLYRHDDASLLILNIEQTFTLSAPAVAA